MQDSVPFGTPVDALGMPGDPNVVEQWILQLVNGRFQSAQERTQQLYNDAQLLEREYASSREKFVSRSNAANQETEYDVPEAANQVDTVHATFTENMFQNGELYTVKALGGEQQSRADATKQIMDGQLERNDAFGEFENAALDYIKIPLVVIKSCIDYTEDVRSERAIVPDTDEALNDLNDLSVMSGQPVRQIGPADPDPEFGFSTAKAFEVTRKQRISNVYPKNVDVRLLAFAEPALNRYLQEQPSIHEAHYWTKSQVMRHGGFRNLDKLGAPNSKDSYYPNVAGNASDPNTPNAQPNDKFPRFLVLESWGELDFMEQFPDLDVNPDVLAFCDKFGLSPADLATPQKFRVWHKEGEVLFGCESNYLARKLRYPYYGTSYYLGRGLWGHSHMQRILGECHMIRAMKNMTVHNTEAKLYQNILGDKFSDIDEKKVADAFKKGPKFIQVELHGNPIDDQLIFIGDKIPDMNATSLPIIGMLQSDIQAHGAPSVLAGNAKAQTATQDAINNNRGQGRINLPFRRFINQVIVPVLEDIRDIILLNTDEAQWVEVCGENGVQMARTMWVTPDQITNRFKICPTASFDMVDRMNKAQQLTALTNIIAGAAAAPPPVFRTVMRMASGIMEYFGFPRNQIDAFTDNQGLGTKPEEEIRVMQYNPQEQINVREDDNHQYCLFVADRAVRDPATGEVINPQLLNQYNFQDYVEKHNFFLQQQMMMQQMQAAMNAPKGPPNQPGKNPPKDQKGAVRQDAQQDSPPDQGIETAAGMTGQGAPAALVPGVPSGV